MFFLHNKVTGWSERSLSSASAAEEGPAAGLPDSPGKDLELVRAVVEALSLGAETSDALAMDVDQEGSNIETQPGLPGAAAEAVDETDTEVAPAQTPGEPGMDVQPVLPGLVEPDCPGTGSLPAATGDSVGNEPAVPGEAQAQVEFPRWEVVEGSHLT